MKQWVHGFISLVVASMLLLAGCGGGQRLTPNGAISGRVPVPAPGTTVTVTVDGNNQTISVNPDGTFHLDCPPGVHTLVVLGANGGQAEAMVVQVFPGGKTEVGEISLRDAGQVAGLVTNAETHAPIASAEVTVTQLIMTFAQDDTPRPVRTTRTDSQGSYVVAGLPIGEYLATVDAPGYQPLTLQVVVTDGATCVGDAALPPINAAANSALEGHISLLADDGSLTPLAGVLVSVQAPSFFAHGGKPTALPPQAIQPDGSTVDFGPTDPPQPAAYAYTDGDGHYRIDNLLPGPCLVEAVRSGLVAASQNVTIVAGQTVVANFTLKLATRREGVVQGEVRDAVEKTPIAGALVYAVYQPQPVPLTGIRRGAAAGGGMVGPETVTTAITDAQGHYQLTVPAEVGAVVVQANGYETMQTPVTVTIGATVTVNISLTPIRLGIVEGTVTNMADGMPIAGATIYPLTNPIPLMKAATHRVATMPTPDATVTRTDADGHYTFKIPVDTQLLGCSVDGYQASYQTVQVQPEATITVNFRLAPIINHPVTLTGRVLSSTGGLADSQPVPGATVYASEIEPWDNLVTVPQPPVILHTATTDANGAYVLTLPAAVYSLSAQHDNLMSEPMIINLFADTTQDVLLQSSVAAPAQRRKTGG